MATTTLPAISRGATWELSLTWKIAGAAVNLSGYSAEFAAWRVLGGDLAFNLTSAAGDIVLGGSAGTIAVTLSAAKTKLLQEGKLRCRLRMIHGGHVEDKLRDVTVEVGGEAVP